MATPKADARALDKLRGMGATVVDGSNCTMRITYKGLVAETLRLAIFGQSIAQKALRIAQMLKRIHTELSRFKDGPGDDPFGITVTATPAGRYCSSDCEMIDLGDGGPTCNAFRSGLQRHPNFMIYRCPECLKAERKQPKEATDAH